MMRDPFSLKLVTAPVAEPLSLEDAKTHLRVDVSDDDLYIGDLIKAARRHMEDYLRRALITQTWDLFMEGFPTGDVIEVPLPPLSSITSIKYMDNAGIQQTWGPGNYRVDKNHEPGRITPNYRVSWPAIRPGAGAVEIRFVAGYGTEGGDVPDDIVHAIRLMVGQMYELRQTGLDFKSAEMLTASRRVLAF